MDPQTSRALVELAAKGVSLSTTTWVLLVIGVIFGSLVGAYMADKGRNLATKEDIADITRRVEAVKAAFAAEAEERAHQHRLRAATEAEAQAQENRLRLAALDKRLEVHQEAYRRWHLLMDNVYNDGVADLAMQCRDWWMSN